MAQIRTRETAAQVGDAGTITNNNGPLSNSQIDQNFINLNNDIATRLPLSGGTLTGTLSVPSQFTVRAAGGEGGEIVLQKGTDQTGLAGDVVLDTLGNTFRVFENGGNFRQIYFNLTNGNITGAGGISISIDGSAASIANNNIVNYLRITNTAGIQKLLMGNQDSSGVNNPSIIAAANGSILLGNGNTWTNDGGTFTSYATLNSSAANFTSPLQQGGNQVLHAGNYTNYTINNAGRIKTYYIDSLGAVETQARRYEIARIGIDFNDWNSVGSFEVELLEVYFAGSLKKRYAVSYGYGGLNSVDLVEMTGFGTNNFRVAIGSPVQVSGDHYYLPVYVDVRYYSACSVVIRTNRQITSDSNSAIGYAYVNTSPTGANISEFTPDSTVNMSNSASAWQVGSNTVLHSGNYNSYALPLAGGDMTGRIRMGTFAPSTVNSGEAWIGRATDRSTGTMTVQLGNDAARVFEVVDKDWTTVIFNAGMNNFTYKGNNILHTNNYGTYLNGQYVRAVSSTPPYQSWNVTGNQTNVIYQINQENFNVGATGNSDFPASATYKYGLLANLTAGQSQAQIYISHNGNDLIFRGGWEGTSWLAWNRVLTDLNYSTYALPLAGGTLTGELTLNGVSTWFAGPSTYLRSNNEFLFLTNTGSAQKARFHGIQVGGSYGGTVPNEGILFGGDTTLTRTATNTLTTSGDFIVTGNLTINGTTTTVNSTVTTLDDPIITLGGDTAPASNDSKDRGVEFRWHNGSAAKVGFFGFDDSTGKFTFIPDATNTSEVFSGTKGIIDAYLDWSNITNNGETLATVTGRGATTSTNVSLLGTGNYYSGHFYLNSYDAVGNHYPHFTDGPNGTGSIVNWRLYTGSTNTTTHIWTNSYTQFNNDLRALRFVDSNDNNYYIDPASTDLSVRVLGEICNSNYAAGNMQAGALNIGRTDTDYSWTGTTWASDVRAGILANCSETWEFIVHDSGDSVNSAFYFDGGARFMLGRDIGWGASYIEAPGSFRSTAFYASDNTSFWWRPGADGVTHRFYTTYGSISIGPQNSSHCHITTDLTNFWFNKDLQVDGSYRIYGDTSNRFSQGALVLRGGSPTVYLRDTDHMSAQLHVNSDTFYLLRGGVDQEGWTQLNSAWPLEINLGTNNALFGGTVRTYSDFRGNIYYDINDTNYYVDSAGTSRLNALNTNVYYQANDITIGYLDTNASAAITAGGSNVLGDGIKQDMLAFNPPTTAETWNGSAWSSVSVPTALFAGKIAQAWSNFDLPSGTTKARFTWNSFGYRFWHSLNASHSTQGNSIRFILETSTDGVTWVSKGTSAWTNSWPGYSTWTITGNSYDSIGWMRITIERDSANTNPVHIGSLSLMGSYGGFSRLFDWDYQRNVTFYNTVQAVDFNSTSDVTKKKDIETIQDALRLVTQLRGVTFNWIATNKPSMGLIAQEVESVLPQVVHTGEDGTKTISYGNLVGLLVECIKSQEDRLTRLENLILHKA